MNLEDAQINAAIDLLRAVGFRVELPDYQPWVTPWSLYLEHGNDLSHDGFLRRINRFQGPKQERRGPGNRLIELRPTAELIAWLKAPKHAGKRSL